MTPIYLDHNATSPMRENVLEAMMPFLTTEFGNASSLHQTGQRARKAVEEAREKVAEFIKASNPEEIIFTSGGTESNNLAIKGVVDVLLDETRKRIVSSAIEHASVRDVIRHLTQQKGLENVVLPVDSDGILHGDDLRDALTPNTLLVSIMGANNEVGTTQPLSEIAKICRQKSLMFHTDAVQMAGKIPINVQELGVDLLSLSAHKMGGPKGIGALYCRKGTRLSSLLQGGRQEKNRRGGTENVAAIVGFGKAAEMSQQNFSGKVDYQKKLRDQFEANLLAKIPCSFVNGSQKKRLCNTTNLCFEYTENSALLMSLDLKGVVCSNGSACASGSPDPSHVLLAMGLPQDKAHASLRFSLSEKTTEKEIEIASEIIANTVQTLRKTHPLWKEVKV